MTDARGPHIHHELLGPDGADVVVLSHSLGMDHAMWDAQVPALAARFRVLRYDIRGHGRSDVPEGPYTLAELGEDVLRLLDAHALDRVHFCGLSIGGLIGMWLGAHAPARLERLVLCNTGARIGTVERWNERIETARTAGIASLAPSVLERWFTPAFRDRVPEVVAAARACLESTPVEGYAGCCAAIRDADLGPYLAAIRAPTLVIAGTHDPATPPADGRRIAGAIPGARCVELPASHLSCLEAADAFTAEVRRFLAGEA
jgi:3-oxoadipate enol-lactonase